MIGTSGWHYDGWRTSFYAGIAHRDRLRHCAGLFTGMEVDATFDRLLREETVRRWCEATPPSLRFALKGHRMVTHTHRWRGIEEPMAQLRAQGTLFGERLSAMLWQLPGDFAKDSERLRYFLALLDLWPEARHAIEFRNESWFDSDIAGALARHRVAVCQSDAGNWPLWDAVTTDFVYLRLHGNPRTHASPYTEASLRDWAAKIRAWRAEGRLVHAYFDNDAEGAAPFDAQALLALI